MPSIGEYFPGIKEGVVTFDAVPIADLGDILDANKNEILELDTTASAVNNFRIANAATGNGPTLSSVGDDTNVDLNVTTKATGTLTLDSGTTGAVNVGTGAAAKTVTVGNTTGASAVAIKSGTGGTIVTSADDNALTVGANGATNPVLKIDASTASVATGLSITGAAAASGLAVAVVSSGTNENLTINAKGSGTIGIGSVSTGAVTITPATTITGLITATGGITSVADIILESGTAVPATAGAVAAGAPITLYSTGIVIEVTSDTPTHTRPKGSICINTGGTSTSTRMYVNTDGAGTWTSFTTAA